MSFLRFVEKYVKLKQKKKTANVIITIIIEYAWICINKQDSEFPWGPKYGKVLNMARFSLCKRYAAF